MIHDWAPYKDIHGQRKLVFSITTCEGASPPPPHVCVGEYRMSLRDRGHTNAGFLTGSHSDANLDGWKGNTRQIFARSKPLGEWILGERGTGTGSELLVEWLGTRWGGWGERWVSRLLLIYSLPQIIGISRSRHTCFSKDNEERLPAGPPPPEASHSSSHLYPGQTVIDRSSWPCSSLSIFPHAVWCIETGLSVTGLKGRSAMFPQDLASFVVGSPSIWYCQRQVEGGGLLHFLSKLTQSSGNSPAFPPQGVQWRSH